jgi:hypothetical protein
MVLMSLCCSLLLLAGGGGASAGTKPDWIRQIGSAGDDRGYAVAVDAGGNLYVAGRTSGDLDPSDGVGFAGGLSDFFLVKYDTSGVRQWTRQMGTAADDVAKGVAVDGSGNVYVAGYTSGGLDGNSNAGPGNADLFVVKFDGSGEKLWTRQMGSTGEDRTCGVAVDANGNAYVTGWTSGDIDPADGYAHTGNKSMFLVAFDRDGQKRWTWQRGPAGTYDEDMARAVAVDGSGNVYLTGTKYPVGSVVVRFTAGGTELGTWQLGGYSSSDEGTGIAVDGDGSAYVTGNHYYYKADGTFSPGLFLAKYDANGSVQWEQTIEEVAPPADEGFQVDPVGGVVADGRGNVYVTGYTYRGLDGGGNAGGTDFFVMKYSRFGVRQWTRQMGSSGYDYATGIAIDGSDNLYVAGFAGSVLEGNVSAGDKDVFLLKYSTLYEWARQPGTSETDEPSGVAVDASGNVYVAGSTSGGLDGNVNAGQQDLFLTKYTGAGARLWTLQEGGSGYDSAGGVAVDGHGNVFLLQDVFGVGSQLVKYDSDGTKRWTQGMAEGCSARYVAVDGNGMIYLAGERSWEYFCFMKYSDDPTGGVVLQWLTKMPAPGMGRVKGLAVDGSGSMFLTGCTDVDIDPADEYPAMGGYDYFLLKYDSAGNRQWIRQMGTDGWDEGRGVAVDGSGGVFVTGYTTGGLDGNTNAGASGYQDIFVVKFDGDGNRQWTQQLGTAVQDEGSAVAVDGTGAAYVTGYTKGSLDGNASAGNSDLILVKYDGSGNRQWTRQVGTDAADTGSVLALNALGDVFVAGTSEAPFGGNLYSGYADIILVKFALGIADTTVPTGSVAVNAGASLTNAPTVALHLTCEDVGGCHSMQFSNDQVQWSPPEPFASSKIWDFTNGSYGGTTTNELKTVYARFMDSTGYWSGDVSDTIFFDDTPPQGTTLAVNSPAPTPDDWTNSRLVTLHLDATDLNNVTAVLVCNQGLACKEDLYLPTMDWVISAGTGLKTLSVRFKDGAGNWSDPVSDTISLDETAPETTALPRGAIGLGEPVPVHLTCEDTGLGCDGTFYRLNGGAWMQYSELLPILIQDTTTLEFYSVDLLGNRADPAPPEVYRFSAVATELSIMLSSQTIKQTDTVDVSGSLSELSTVAIDLSGLRILLDVAPPPPLSVVVTYETTTDSASGHYVLRGIGGTLPDATGVVPQNLFGVKGTYGIKARFAGTGLLQAAESSAQALLVGNSAGYAVIVEGKIPTDPVGQQSHNKTTNRVYEHLLSRGFAAANVFYFNYAAGQPGVDGPPVKTAIADAISVQVLERMNKVPAPLWVVMVDHGSPGKFHLDNDWISPEELNGWLGALERGLSDPARLEKRIVVIGSCYAGSFVDLLRQAPVVADPTVTPPVVVDGGRLIVTSATGTEESYKGPQEPDGVRSGEFFIEELFKGLVKGTNLKEAFASATALTESFTSQGSQSANAANAYGDRAVQHPLLEDDGVGGGSNVVTEAEGDGVAAAGVYLGVGLTNSAANPADLERVTPTQYLEEGVEQALLWAQADVHGYVDTAWVEVKAPRTVLQGGGESGGSGQLSLEIPRVFLDPKDAVKQWEYVYGKACGTEGCFREPGRYDVYYFTRNAYTEEISGMKRSSVYKNWAGNPEPEPFFLLLPENGAVTLPVLLLDWSDSVDPDCTLPDCTAPVEVDPHGSAVTYTVMISDDSFATVDYLAEELPQSELAVDAAAGLVRGRTYSWKVIAVDAFGARRESGSQSFTTSDTNPALPGYASGCVTDALSSRAVGSPSVSAGALAVRVFPNGCFSVFGASGQASITVGAVGYKERTVAAQIPAGRTTTANVSLMPIHRLAVRKIGNGAGTVSGGGISCGTTCARNFDGGTRVTLEETHGEGVVFAGWGDDCGGTGPCTLTMDRARNVSARFMAAMQQLTIARTGNGSGQVGVDSGSVAWQGGVGTATYAYGTEVALSAAADEGMYFVGWGGACESFGAQNRCTVRMDDARSVVAEFGATVQELRVTVLGLGSGRAVDDRGALTWSGNVGTAEVLYGTPVTLTALPDIGSVFGGWVGAGCGPETDCAITVRGRTEVSAVFSPEGGSGVAVVGGLLQVGGEPFTVKGVVYSPVPVGEDPALPPYGDYFTRGHAGIYERDLPLLRGMNANAVRILGWDAAADHADFLNKAYNGGVDPIRVIAGYRIAPGLDVDPAIAGNDREQIKAEFRAMVAAHKGHPGILMWAIGGDLGSGGAYGGNQAALFGLIDEMAAEAHAEDPNHPVVVDLADADFLAAVNGHDSTMAYLDLWGVSAYRGGSFGNLFADYAAASVRPLIVLGYGVDAYDQAGGAADEQAQADQDVALWGEIAANGDQCAGGTVTEFADQWWAGRLAEAWCADAVGHDTCQTASAAMPDGYDNVEWWGLAAVADNGAEPDLVIPRAAYGRLQGLFWSAGGALRVNGGAPFTKSTAVELSINAPPGAVLMCLSNGDACADWEEAASRKGWVLEPGDGAKTVTVWFKDALEAVTGPWGDAIVLDAAPPSDGTLAGEPGPGRIALSWDGFADGGSGVGSYAVVCAIGTAPASCTAGTVAYAGTATTFTHLRLTNATYAYRVCARDRAGNFSSGATWSGKPTAEGVPPVGEVTINAGAVATKGAAVTLALAAVDDSTPLQMCVSNTASCTAWTAFAPTRPWLLSAGNGVKRVNVWFRDAWGNAAPFFDTIILDTVRPLDGVVAATPGLGRIDVKWNGFSDPQSGIAGYTVVYKQGGIPASCAVGTPVPGCDGTGTSCGHSGLINAVYGYRVCAIDKAGNISTGAAGSTRPWSPESAPPSGTVRINGGAAWTRSATVTLSLTATDESPPLQMCVSNAAATCTAWVPFAATKAWVLPAGDGEKTVYVRFRDAWRNTTPVPVSDTIRRDATPPANGTVTATPGAGKIDLSWEGFREAEGASGIVGYKVVYAVGAAPASCAAGKLLGTNDEGAVPGTGSATHAGLANALYGYRVCAIDRAGNVSTGAAALKRPLAWEGAPPTAAVLVNGGAEATRSAAVTLSLTATSPVAPSQMCVSNTDTAPCTAWTAFAAKRAWTLPAGNGGKAVYAWFRDTWLNTTAAPASDTIILDATAPTNGTLSGTVADRQITLAWQDFADNAGGSGIASYKLVFAKTTPPASCAAGTALGGVSGETGTYTHTGLTNGTLYGYRVCAVDAAGNMSKGAVWSGRPAP